MPTDESASELEELLEYVKADDRICPMPIEWHTLWSMLPEALVAVHPSHTSPGMRRPLQLNRSVTIARSAPKPLILSGWHYSSDDAKASRLEEHIRWAFEHGELGPIAKYLRNLPVERWYRRSTFRA